MTALVSEAITDRVKLSEENNNELISTVLYLAITAEDQAELLAKVMHRRELARFRHAKWREAHKDELTANKLAKKIKRDELKILNGTVSRSIGKKGPKPKLSITTDDIKKLLLRK